MTPRERSLALDLLRAIAIILVLGRHIDPCPAAVSPLLHHITSIWKTGGWVGVDIFFVLSGFLISGLLFKEVQRHGEIRLGRFFVRRGLKIYPAFIVFILATIAVRFALRGEFDWRAVLSELFFVQNYLGGLWGHTWSLGVEEHFYLLLPPVLIFLIGRNSSRVCAKLSVLFLAVSASCLLLRTQMNASLPFSFQREIAPTHLRIDSLLFGVLLSAFHFYRNEQFRWISKTLRWPLTLAGCTLLCLPFIFPLEQTQWMPRTGFSLLYLGAGMLLMGALGFEMPSNAFVLSLSFVGAHSYSIYLWHAAAESWVPLFAQRLLPGHWSWFTYCGIYLGFSFPLGIGMSKLIEFPILKLRDRFFPSRSTSEPQGAETPLPATRQAALVRID